MAIEQLDLETGLNKVDFAIELLKTWEPQEGYYFADSGGACSTLTRALLIKSRVKFDAHYCVSPVDPPQIHKFLKEYHADTQWDYHAVGFFNLVVKKGLPMRNARWCCQLIKEAGGEGRTVVVGNRAAESTKRAKQCFIENSYNKRMNKIFVRPILMFSDYDLWQYIRENNIPYCSLYDEEAKRKGYGEGLFKRLGCVLCPFSGNTNREEQYFPQITKLWKLACDRIVERHKEQNYLTKSGKPMKHHFETGEELYQWWIKRK